MSFVHLHVHTWYSLLDGLGSPAKLIKRAKEYGMSALAITDHGAMYGVIDFYKEAKKQGIKPIIGVETYVAKRSHLDKEAGVDIKPAHLTLLAKNFTGYQNLMRLVSIAHCEGYYYRPRIDHELLKRFSKGLVILSGCMQGEVSRAVRAGDFQEAERLALAYKSYVSEGDFYLEMQSNPGIPDQAIVNQGLVKLGKKLSIPLVATNDIHYVDKDDAACQDILLCIQTQKFLSDEDRMSFLHDDYSLVSPQEMIASFSDQPEAITNTLEIAKKCNVEIPLDARLIPAYRVPEGEDHGSYLRKLCFEGLKERYDINISPTATAMTVAKAKKKLTEGQIEIIDRLEYELELIHNMGFDTYFLIVWDFVYFSKSNNIMVGPGRGSAAGSIVSYCLKITDIDPIRYGLVFERFLNPNRVSMPDIDLDFADSRRSEVIEYVTGKYGRDNVAQIVTFGTLKARAAVRDVGRVMGIPYSEVDAIAKMISERPGTVLANELKTDRSLQEAYQASTQNQNLLDMAVRLEGVPRHSSVHACAVVISEDPLVNYTPLQIAAKGDLSLVTQYSMYPIDQLGLLKMDFLGLKNLTVLQEAVRIIRKIKGKEIDLANLPLNDKKVFELLTVGATTGVFQLESGGMRRYLKELKPTEFEDIIAMVALYRPGPMEWIPDYIAGKHDPKRVKYIHTDLRPILKKTYGVGVYQEQILQIARVFAGFSLGEADILRRAIGKKIKEEMDAQRSKFIHGGMGKGYSKELSAEIFDHVVTPFAGYGFNKSHAACYAMIAYQTAYLKAHYPSEFMAALMTADQDNTERLSLEIAECEDLGIRVLPPSVNESVNNFTVTKDCSIRFGLSAIKNLGDAPVTEIIRARKELKDNKEGGRFTSLANFLERVNYDFINKKMLEALAMSGALDEFGERRQIVNSTDRLSAYAKSKQAGSCGGQMNIFGLMDKGVEEEVSSLRLDPCNPATKEERLHWERELLGMYVSENPLLELYRRYRGKATRSNSIKDSDEGLVKRLVGILGNIKRITTRNGVEMAFATLEDVNGKIELVVFPSVFDEARGLLVTNQFVHVRGKVSTRDGERKLLVNKMARAALNDSEEIKNLNEDDEFEIKLSGVIAPEKLQKLKILLQHNKGATECVIYLNSSRRIRVPFKVNKTDELEKEIAKIFV